MQGYTNKLTFIFLRWVFGQKRTDKFSQCRSASEIKELLLRIYPDSSENFKKGLKFIDFGAIYEWFQDKKTNQNKSKYNTP